MMTVSANELINAGVTFQMVSEDAGFGPDGELIGYTEVSTGRETYDSDGDYRNRWFSTSEGVTDTTELSQPYWDAVAEAHVAQMQREAWLAEPKASDAKPMHGAMEFWQTQRAERFARLMRFIKRNPAKARKVKQGVRERYIASVKQAVGRNRGEWWMLYLTKEQYQTIMQA